jgi:hypothetical protein
MEGWEGTRARACIQQTETERKYFWQCASVNYTSNSTVDEEEEEENKRGKGSRYTFACLSKNMCVLFFVVVVFVAFSRFGYMYRAFDDELSCIKSCA